MQLIQEVKKYLSASNEDNLFIERVIDSLPDEFKEIEVAEISSMQLDLLFDEALKQIEDAKSDRSSAERKFKWDNGWGENSIKLTKNGNVEDSLRPGYYRKNSIVRLGDRWVQADNDDVDYVLARILSRFVFFKYMSDVEAIYEFGSGSCHNIFDWSRLNPHTKFFAFDWASSVLDIGKQLRTHVNIETYLYDFFHPVDLPANEAIDFQKSAAISFGALEQTGEGFRPFIDKLIGTKFKRVVHVEPIVEFYDEKLLLDYLGKKFIINRGYLNGLYDHLVTLESLGKISIDEASKVKISGKMHLGWSIVVWHAL
jgi:hypothetical protein